MFSKAFCTQQMDSNAKYILHKGPLHKGYTRLDFGLGAFKIRPRSWLKPLYKSEAVCSPITTRTHSKTSPPHRVLNYSSTYRHRAGEKQTLSSLTIPFSFSFSVAIEQAKHSHQSLLSLYILKQPLLK